MFKEVRIPVSCPEAGLYFDLRSEKNQFQADSKFINYKLKPRMVWKGYSFTKDADENVVMIKGQGTYYNPDRKERRQRKLEKDLKYNDLFKH